MGLCETEDLFVSEETLNGGRSGPIIVVELGTEEELWLALAFPNVSEGKGPGMVLGLDLKGGMETGLLLDNDNCSFWIMDAKEVGIPRMLRGGIGGDKVFTARDSSFVAEVVCVVDFGGDVDTGIDNTDFGGEIDVEDAGFCEDVCVGGLN